MSDISFRKCFELFQRSDRVGSSLKMFAACLVSNLDEYSPKLSHHWKAKATRSLRFVFLLQPSKPRTGEIGSGLLLTPTASENEQDIEKFKARMEKYPNGTTMPNLATQILSCEMLLTPSTVNIEPKEGRYEKRKAYRESIGRQWVPGGLAEQVAMLPTPDANMNRETSKEWKPVRPSGQQATFTLNDAVNTGMTRSEKTQATDGANSGLRLQPAFVEWMMGFPMNYTSLEAETTGSVA